LITPGIYKKVNTSEASFININNELRCWNWGNGWAPYGVPDPGWFFEERHKVNVGYKIAPWTLGAWSD
jgi:hypothetical protein